MNYNKSSILFRLTVLIILLFTNGISSNAQDPRERLYNYPILNPSHAPKPKVEGWANKRVSEKINRGIIAVQSEEDNAYISWRLLETDGKDVAFNLYRSVNGEKEKKLNDSH